VHQRDYRGASDAEYSGPLSIPGKAPAFMWGRCARSARIDYAGSAVFWDGVMFISLDHGNLTLCFVVPDLNNRARACHIGTCRHNKVHIRAKPSKSKKGGLVRVV